MMPNTYTAREVADRIGIRLTTFYRNRRHYELVDKMPRPVCSGGRHRYERTSMDAWLTRFHPLRPPAPANDPVAPPAAASVEEHRQRFALEYGSGGA